MSTTQTTSLQRISVEEVDPEKLITKNVMQYAGEKIGYNHPLRIQQVGQGRLAEALRIIGVRPFTDDSVEYYKAKKVRQCSMRDAIISRTFFPFLWMIAIPAVAYLVIGLIVALNNMKAADIASAPFIHFIALSSPIAAMTIALWIAFYRVHDKIGRWKSYNLSGYDKPVPEFALATAVELHQRVPEIEFQIQELSIVENKVRDPFLVAVFQKERYYLEVWDEPGYKQKRKA